MLRRTLLLVLTFALGLLPTASAHATPGRGRGFDCQAAERLLALLGTHPGQGVGRGLLERARRQALQALEGHYADRCVALNHLQVLGTHNSYHVEPVPELLRLLLIFDDQFLAWEYTHLPLDQQFERQGIRQIELDVFHDPQGGLYAQPFGLFAVQQDPNQRIPELEPPGLKVLHVQDLDFETRCPTLVACLQVVKAWSDAHPGHLPLTILVEVKDDPIPDPLGIGFVRPLLFDAAAFDTLDAEIRSVFPAGQLLTPDDVRGGRATLEEAVLLDGWPVLADVRGRVLFALDNGGAKRSIYRQGRPSLEGRVLFTNAVPGDADAAFVKLNNPIADGARISELVAAGYVVRTRADADTLEARLGDTTQRDAALASGAQFVSSDYPEPDPRFGTGYQVTIPGGAPARCNPVSAPPGCRNTALERLD